MDSLTQIVLGAAVGEIIAGRRLGYRAALWGAIGGTIPDLDVISALFVDPVSYLTVHRGFSHSIFFAPLLAPLFATIPWLLHRKHLDEFKIWFKIMFWALLTHPILDTFTGYGTQLLNPFSNYGFEINSIFIIDPIYTLPFLFFLILSTVVYRKKYDRTKWAKIGIIISTVYLVSTVFMKFNAEYRIRESAANNNIEIIRMMTIPGPFTSFLWRGLIESNDGFHQAYYSVFDNSSELVFHFSPKERSSLDRFEGTRALEVLTWFSKGYFTVHEDSSGVILNDLRFGSIKGWSGDFDSHVFSFRLYFDQDQNATFEQVHNEIDITPDDFRTLLIRKFSVE